MSKIKPSDLEHLTLLVKRKEKINKLREKLDDQIEELMKKLGPCTHTVELNRATSDGERFLRINLVDNLEAITEGKKLWKSAAFTRFEITYKFLKNEPKEEKFIRCLRPN